MDLRIKPKADLGSWRALGRRSIFFLLSFVALRFVWNFVIAFAIIATLQATEPYAQWDPVTFQEWKVLYEMAALTVVWLPSIAFLIARIFFDISSIPLQNQQMQLAEIDRVEKIKETAAASNEDTQDLASLDFERRAPLNPIQATVPVQAAVPSKSPQSSHDTDAQRSSWAKEVLARLTAVSSPEQTPSAAGTSSEPLPGTSHNPSRCSNASTETHPGVTQFDPGSVPEAHTAPDSIATSVSSRLQRRRPSRLNSESSIVTVPEHDVVAPSGEDTRERLLKEILSWPYAPNEDRLREFLQFDSDDPERPFCIPRSRELNKERRMLERRSAKGQVMYTEGFRVYGIPELWQHDRLKCWVYLNQFCHGQRWPEGYIPLCSGEELNSYVEHDIVDDMTSIWSGVASNDSQI